MTEMNAQPVNIKMRDGSVFQGYINIGSCRRLSDFFRRSDASPFVVMFETNMGENREKSVYFLNWDHILWVEPREPHGPPSFRGDVTFESEPG
ncbi:MAG TPA: hypothetical protein VEF34_17510 [Syntrophobacteraceae bacterium]|nr:hypothetical protein [Syntrophobacteraceae bacterium]